MPFCSVAAARGGHGGSGCLYDERRGCGFPLFSSCLASAPLCARHATHHRHHPIVINIINNNIIINNNNNNNNTQLLRLGEVEALVLLLLRWDCLDAAAAIVKRNLKRVSKHMRAQSQFVQSQGKAAEAAATFLEPPRRLTRLAFFAAFARRCARATRAAAERASVEAVEIGRGPAAAVKGRRRTLQWCMSAMVNVFRFYQETDPTFCQPRGRPRGVRWVGGRCAVLALSWLVLALAWLGLACLGLCFRVFFVLSHLPPLPSPRLSSPSPPPPPHRKRRSGGRLTAGDASVESVDRERARTSGATSETITESPMAEACTGVFPAAVFRPLPAANRKGEKGEGEGEGERDAQGQAAGDEGAETKDESPSFRDPLEEEIRAAEVQCRAMFGLASQVW